MENNTKTQVFLHFEIPSPVHKALKVLAISNGLRLRDYVLDVLMQHLGKTKQH